MNKLEFTRSLLDKKEDISFKVKTTSRFKCKSVLKYGEPESRFRRKKKPTQLKRNQNKNGKIQRKESGTSEARA